MSTFNMGEFMKFNKPQQQQLVQQQTMMNHGIINQVQGMTQLSSGLLDASVEGQHSIYKSQQQLQQQKQLQSMMNIYGAGKSVSWSAQMGQQSVPGTSGLFNTNPAHQQPQQQLPPQQQQQPQPQPQPQQTQNDYVVLETFQYDCEHCSYSATSKENLQDHMRLHGGEKPHICGLCGLRFTYKNSLDKHMSLHKVKDKKSFSCDSCSMVFARQSDLSAHALTHALTHQKQIPLRCAECGELFTNQEQLNTHMEIHKGYKIGKQIMCNVCQKQMSTSKELVSHMQMVHGSDNPYTCPECGVGYRAKHTLTQHMRTHKKDTVPVQKPIMKATVKLYSSDVMVLQPDGKLVKYKNRPFKCTKCRKGFQLPGHLKVHDHIRLHTGEKPHQCGICGHGFTFKKSLDIHIKNHKVKKSFPCDTCSMIFARKSDLNSHVLIHASQVSSKCTECGEQFVNQESLHLHMEIHKLGTPIVCTLCQKPCLHKRELMIHMRVHTGGNNPYTCQHCGMGFRARNSLQSHMLVHNDKDDSTQKTKDLESNYSGVIMVLQPDGRLVKYKKRPFRCAICRKGFTAISYLKTHSRKCHP